MKTTPSTGRTADPPRPLHSPIPVLFAGLSYVMVGVGFSYLDRRFGSWAQECSLWLVWAGLGFGAGMANLGRSASGGRILWIVLGTLGVLWALLEGLAIYHLQRWTALTLMVVIGARAAVLKTRRDYALTLMSIFVVSFLVGTHRNADGWLLLFLGAAWALGGLSLAWDHAAESTLSGWSTLGMTLGFIAAACVVAALLFFFAPRPPVLGFGFLPPGTDTPGLFPQAAGGEALLGKAGGESASAAGAGQGQGQGQGKLSGSLPVNILPLLVLAVSACVLWRRRYHLGVQLVLGGAWLLAGCGPARSMRLSAQAMKWCLHLQGHQRRPGESVREHWRDATGIAPLASIWLEYAVESYCAIRFGKVRATRQQAKAMRTAVLGAHDILRNVVPVLST